MNHSPWDSGVLADIFTPLGVTHKTVKTVCGIRVKIERANHKEEITCVSCLDEINRREHALEEIRRYAESKGVTV